MNDILPTPVPVQFDAGRVCEAIARIGYEPYTAIMDLIDNAVTAKSSVISISLLLRPGKTLKMRNGVAKYQVLDNGQGMDHSEILNAFTLGSRKAYLPNSLSKYGMGLKSAGLSLGSRISIISKKNGVLSQKYTFDIEEIESRNELLVFQKALTAEETQQMTGYITGNSGTLIEISGCENVNQSSPGATISKLRDRLGVIYYSFLNNDAAPLVIRTRVSADGTSGEFENVQPKDLLFLEKAALHTAWTPDTYDYFSPYLVLNSQWDGLRDKDNAPLPPISIQAVAFPQASMADDKSPLSPEEKALVKSYGVSRENSGFFIYRNGRLIRWGDGVERPNGKPLVTKDDINIRIRFEIKDVHDDVLHVDVSKQRLDIDDEIVAALEQIVSGALRTAKEIRAACKDRLKQKHGDGQHFSDSVRDVAEDDPQESGAGEPSAATITRQSEKNAEAQKTLLLIKEEDTSAGADSEQPNAFQKIRYSEKIPYGQVWKPYFDSIEGVFVCVNKNHPFYQQFVSRFIEGTSERLMVEALIFACALAENNVLINETATDQTILDRVFRRFHKNIDQFLSEWTWENLEDE